MLSDQRSHGHSALRDSARQRTGSSAYAASFSSRTNARSFSLGCRALAEDARDLGDDAALFQRDQVLRGFSVDAQIERLGKERERLALEPRVEPSSGVGRRDLDQRLVGERAAQVARAIERRVVQQHELAALTGAHVVGDAVEPEIERATQARERVLGCFERRSAIAQDPRRAGDVSSAVVVLVVRSRHGGVRGFPVRERRASTERRRHA
jgi:hypothetical protein